MGRVHRQEDSDKHKGETQTVSVYVSPAVDYRLILDFMVVTSHKQKCKANMKVIFSIIP